MPIYAYRCGACGFSKDALQKVSDAPLTQCPSCGKPEFRKQVTAAGFQLKGSGWYVTDFRGGSGAAGASAAKNDAKSDGAKPDSASDSAAPTPTPTPATGTTGGSTD
jgi:putative FmdB family regulatory protein